MSEPAAGFEGLQQRLAPFGRYLEDIRRRLYATAVLFAVAFVLGFFLTAPLFKLASGLFQIPNVKIVTTSPFQFLDLAMSVGFFVAVVACLPLLCYHVYSFLSPGLTRPERRRALVYAPVVLLLFVVGFAYGFGVMYYAMGVIAAVNISVGILNYWDIGRYLSQMLLTSALLGIIFQFPPLLNLLIRSGFMGTDFLRAKRRHVVLGIFIFVSLLPPTDGVSLVVMSLPLILMFELTIFLNRHERYRLARAAAPAAGGDPSAST